MTEIRDLLTRTADLAATFLDGLDARPVGGPVDLVALRQRMGGPLPEVGAEPVDVVSGLSDAAAAGLVATAGPRYFGFVIGGSLPAAVAADWLTSTWDQNAGLYVISPAAAVAEEVAGDWLVDLLGLPSGTSVGFVTGATMANFTALAAARHAVLAAAGWDVERHGLQGAPPVTVITHEGTHVTVYASLQMLGLGREGERVRRIESDDQGRMRPDALRSALAGIDGPTIVCTQVGNVNTGAFDPLDELIPIAHERGTWVHVDGAFGIWAAAVPSMRHLMRGHDAADSWSTDAHKWLNVPYDSGLVFVRDRAAHHAAMTLGAAYYVETAGGERDNCNWVPESSRRARGFAVLAALRGLGRAGVVDLIERRPRSCVAWPGSTRSSRDHPPQQSPVRFHAGWCRSQGNVPNSGQTRAEAHSDAPATVPSSRAEASDALGSPSGACTNAPGTRPTPGQGMVRATALRHRRCAVMTARPTRHFQR